LVLLLACGKGESAPVAPTDPPPAAYAAWWRELEECLDRTGAFDRVRWETRAGSDFECVYGRCAAIWHPDHRIVIADAWRTDELVVKHEMMHDLLGGSGHPSPPFGGTCSSTSGTAGS